MKIRLASLVFVSLVLIPVVCGSDLATWTPAHFAFALIFLMIGFGTAYFAFLDALEKREVRRIR